MAIGEAKCDAHKYTVNHTKGNLIQFNLNRMRRGISQAENHKPKGWVVRRSFPGQLLQKNFSRKDSWPSSHSIDSDAFSRNRSQYEANLPRLSTPIVGRLIAGWWIYAGQPIYRRWLFALSVETTTAEPIERERGPATSMMLEASLSKSFDAFCSSVLPLKMLETFQSKVVGLRLFGSNSVAYQSAFFSPLVALAAQAPYATLSTGHQKFWFRTSHYNPKALMPFKFHDWLCGFNW